MSTEIVIVGAGAAGLATAIFARRLGCRTVRVVDGAARPGAKILVSGGSRCNVTNAVVTERDYWGGRRTIIRRVLARLPVAETIAFFHELGVPLKEEPTAKLFPRSDRSRDVLDALLGALSSLDVALSPSTRVHRIEPVNDGFELDTSRGSLHASTVVLATGGLSLPKTGSDGGGLLIARAFGHTIVPTTPALAPMVLEAPGIHERLSGVAQEVELALRSNGRTAERIQGPMLWTHFGISGPAALDMSRHWLRARLEGHQPSLRANLRPGHTFESIETAWTRLSSQHPRLALQNALAELLPASAAAALLDALGIDGAVRLAQFSREQRRALSHGLTAFPLPVRDSRGYNYAEATAGGVALDEVDPATMESRKQPGLFLVGEMLDVDGRLGGFNFQWAWSSARAAAEGLARRASAVALAVAILFAVACNRNTSAPVRVIDLLERVDQAELRPGEGAFTVVQHRCGDDSRPSLSVPPVSRVTWQTTLPERGRLVTAAALTGGADASASFRIGISDDRTYEALLVRPVAAAACGDGWVPMEVDLSGYAGRKLSLFYQPWKTAWRVIFSVTQDAGAPAQAFWAMPAIDADRKSARAFFEKRRN